MLPMATSSILASMQQRQSLHWSRRVLFVVLCRGFTLLSPDRAVIAHSSLALSVVLVVAIVGREWLKCADPRERASFSESWHRSTKGKIKKTQLVVVLCRQGWNLGEAHKIFNSVLISGESRQAGKNIGPIYRFQLPATSKFVVKVHISSLITYHRRRSNIVRVS